MPIPDPRWETPELLTPNRKPIGNVVIDWEHPLARGLKFCVLPDINATEIALGLKGTNEGGFDVYESTGRHIRFNSNTDNIWYENHIFKEVINAVTMVYVGSVTGTASFGAFFIIPYRQTAAWQMPYISLGWGQDNATSSGRLTIARDAGFRDGSFTDAGYYDYDEVIRQYAVTRKSNEVIFYKEGKQFGTPDTGYMTNDIDWGEESDITISERNHNVTGEGISGIVKQALIYNRALSPTEIRSLHRNYTQFLIPE